MPLSNRHNEQVEVFRILVLSELYRNAANDTPLKYLQLQSRTLVNEYTDEALAAVLHFLESAGFATMRFAPLGARRLYRITAAGMLLMEREYAAHLEEPAAKVKNESPSKQPKR